MKTYSVNLQLELARSLVKLATCMLVTRTDGLVYGFTTHDKAFTFGGITYLPAASFTPTDVASNDNLDTDNLSIVGMLASNTITEDDIRASRWDYFTYRIFQVNWADLMMGDKKDSTGHIGQITVGRQTFIAELLGLMEAYGTSIGDITQPGCHWNLGDVNCGVNLITSSPSLTVTGIITSTAGDFFTMFDTARTEANGFFQEGIMTVLSGQAIGLAYDVKSYVVGSWVTKVAVAYDLAGAMYTMHAGCGKDFLLDCVARFSNGARFGGQPWLRGNDVLVQVGRHAP